MGEPEVPDMNEWIMGNVPKGGNVAVDPYLTTVNASRSLKHACKNAGVNLLATEGQNLIDQLWSDKAPFQPSEVLLLDTKFAGESASNKLKVLRERLSKKNANGTYC